MVVFFPGIFIFIRYIVKILRYLILSDFGHIHSGILSDQGEIQHVCCLGSIIYMYLLPILKLNGLRELTFLFSWKNALKSSSVIVPYTGFPPTIFSWCACMAPP